MSLRTSIQKIKNKTIFFSDAFPSLSNKNIFNTIKDAGSNNPSSHMLIEKTDVFTGFGNSEYINDSDLVRLLQFTTSFDHISLALVIGNGQSDYIC